MKKIITICLILGLSACSGTPAGGSGMAQWETLKYSEHAALDGTGFIRMGK